MGADVIVSFKVIFKWMHIEVTLDNIDADVKNIKKLDVLIAMRFFTRGRCELPITKIKKCSAHKKMLGLDQGWGGDESREN